MRKPAIRSSRSARKVLLVSLVATTALLLLGQRTQGVITLDATTTYQTITGWEAIALPTFTDYDDVLPAFDELLDQTVNDLGINRIRLEAWSGAENPVDYYQSYLDRHMTHQEQKQYRYEIINDNSDPFTINWEGFHFTATDYLIETFVLPLREHLKAKGEELYVNFCYVDFGASSFEHHDYPEEYAEFMLAFFEHVSSEYGFVPDAIEIILEPDNSAWTGTHIGNVVVATANRLRQHSFDVPDIILPSVANPNDEVFEYYDAAAAVPGAKEYFTEISYHRYGRRPTAEFLAGVRSRIRADGLVGGAMTEWWSRRNTYRILHDDLKNGWNTAWQQGIFGEEFNPPAALYQINANDLSIEIGENTKFTRQYFKFIRRGAQRIDAASNADQFDPLAFVNADGTYVVVVEASSGGSFVVHGLPAGIYGLKRTTIRQYDVDEPDQTINTGDTVFANMPAAGVLTIYAKPTSSRR